MERIRFHATQGVELSGWEHVEHGMVLGESPAKKPPAFERLRWGK